MTGEVEVIRFRRHFSSWSGLLISLFKLNDVFLAKAKKEMIRIMILKNIIKYEHDGVEEDDDKNGCN